MVPSQGSLSRLLVIARMFTPEHVNGFRQQMNSTVIGPLVNLLQQQGDEGADLLNRLGGVVSDLDGLLKALETSPAQGSTKCVLA